MRTYFAVILLLSIPSTAHLAQSRRVPPNQTAKVTDQAVAAAADRTAKDLFEEANDYAKAKYAEFEQKKLPYNEALRAQIQREQKQLAAKYSLLVSQRTNLSGD